ncbi:MAG TPA: hypothetical protein P5567_11485 [Kiritimatiellia bacterium]|nr:hypothetical protein [Kiritimatiellia bacterium]HSA17483.1 hypothetical protein [Kiritimatiellia bacterium]
MISNHRPPVPAQRPAKPAPPRPRYREDHERWTIPEGLPDEDLRELLIQRINEIDQTKREIKTQVHEANVRAHEEGLPRDRAWQVRAQDKDKHLTREREEVRRVLGEVNARLKQGRLDIAIAKAFVAVARKELPQEAFEGLMGMASAKAGQG